MNGSSEPVRPKTPEEAIELLRQRAQSGRLVGLKCSFQDLPEPVQDVLYGIAAQLEEVADFMETWAGTAAGEGGAPRERGTDPGRTLSDWMET